MRKKERREEKAKAGSMELMIIMIAVLCLLDDFMVVAFAVSTKPARTSCIYLKVHFDQKQGWGGAGASGASFLPLPNRERPGACTCLALTLDISVWVSCVVCTCELRVAGKRAAERNHPTVQWQQVMQGVCQCCWKMLLELSHLAAALLLQ